MQVLESKTQVLTVVQLVALTTEPLAPSLELLILHPLLQELQL